MAHSNSGPNRSLCRIHRSLRVTPPMAAGVTDRLWEMGELVELGEK